MFETCGPLQFHPDNTRVYMMTNKGEPAPAWNFDVKRQKGTVKQAKVTAIEDVTGAAGAFKAWKIEISSAEGDGGQQTVWIDAASRRVVKTTATLPQMGGATATAELVK